jgi:hypothetical protein
VFFFAVVVGSFRSHIVVVSFPFIPSQKKYFFSSNFGVCLCAPIIKKAFIIHSTRAASSDNIIIIIIIRTKRHNDNFFFFLLLLLLWHRMDGKKKRGENWNYFIIIIIIWKNRKRIIANKFWKISIFFFFRSELAYTKSQQNHNFQIYIYMRKKKKRLLPPLLPLLILYYKRIVDLNIITAVAVAAHEFDENFVFVCACFFFFSCMAWLSPLPSHPNQPLLFRSRVRLSSKNMNSKLIADLYVL